MDELEKKNETASLSDDDKSEQRQESVSALLSENEEVLELTKRLQEKGYKVSLRKVAVSSHEKFIKQFKLGLLIVAVYIVIAGIVIGLVNHYTKDPWEFKISDYFRETVEVSDFYVSDPKTLSLSEMTDNVVSYGPMATYEWFAFYAKNSNILDLQINSISFTVISTGDAEFEFSISGDMGLAPIKVNIVADQEARVTFDFREIMGSPIFEHATHRGNYLFNIRLLNVDEIRASDTMYIIDSISIDAELKK